VIPVRHELNVYTLFVRNSAVKGVIVVFCTSVG
jgi:hypothetical protein